MFTFFPQNVSILFPSFLNFLIEAGEKGNANGLRISVSLESAENFITI